MFGYSRIEMVGQPVELLLPLRFREQHVMYRKGYTAAPSMRSMGHGRELFARRRDGSEFPVEIGLNPLNTPQGAMVMASIGEQEYNGGLQCSSASTCCTGL